MYCGKCGFEFWEYYYALLLFFFRSCLAVVAKNNPTGKQIDAEIQATLKHGPAWKLTLESIQSLFLQNCKLNYATVLHSFILSSVVSKVSVADFEHE